MPGVCQICKRDAGKHCFYMVEGQINDDGTFVRVPNPVACLVCVQCAEKHIYRVDNASWAKSPDVLPTD